ncbi:NAD(+)/NADH kinase [Paeniglutamicibacter antarcticus]|uniref:NAD(+)/NADH kinase n=1 Tax=Arthrobacter terrae TaxID=2935737 RepID=A0A931CRT0_9MICC|nr:diacylglycerol kinase family protein [Arthrobacter terrae]MBG0741021.1 NAD(+)/NADH kinase [Arthrobacter terrae]
MAQTQPRQGKRAAVVINPIKSPGDDFKPTFSGLCADAGWDEPLWLETTKDDPGRGQTKEALDAGVDVVIAAGGDGTVRCVAGVLAGTDTAMGLVPLGTGNLLARNLGIFSTAPVTAARNVLHGTETKIDVVQARLDDEEHGRIFLVAAGLGYDASIMADAVEGLKDRVGWLAYVESGIRNLSGKPVTARITVDGKEEGHRKVRGVMVGNCGKLMGGVEIFPGAVNTDGILDLLTLAPHGRFGWISVIAGVLGKNKSTNRSVRSLSGKTADIVLDRPQEFQLDGDHLGQATRLRVSVDPLALTIRMKTSGPDTD